MKLKDLAYEAYHALSANRMRSFLTILGIVIGISSVIAMTSMVNGMSNAMTNSMGKNQARVITISLLHEATKSDFAALAARMPELETIMIGKSGSGDLQRESKTYRPLTGISGVESRYAFAMALKVSQGKFFGDADVSQAARVVVVGKGAVKALFGSEDASALGQEITIGSDAFTIVGILDGNASTQNYGAVYVPLSTLETRLDLSGSYTGTALAKGEPSKEEMEVLSKKTGREFTAILGGKDVEETVSVYSMSQVLDQVNTIMGGFGLLLGGIAAISLVVGGIGIMNMMLTNVTERIREIGLRKALGAHGRDIVRQFLLEAVVLTVIGGLVGIVLGYAGSWALAGLVSMAQPTMSFAPIISFSSVALAVGVSVFIGIAFGYYPARRAAKLDPIEALRYQ